MRQRSSLSSYMRHPHDYAIVHGTTGSIYTSKANLCDIKLSTQLHISITMNSCRMRKKRPPWRPTHKMPKREVYRRKRIASNIVFSINPTNFHNCAYKKTSWRWHNNCTPSSKKLGLPGADPEIEGRTPGRFFRITTQNYAYKNRKKSKQNSVKAPLVVRNFFADIQFGLIFHCRVFVSQHFRHQILSDVDKLKMFGTV